jgi:L-ascorbate metabolism protein UlaG (beta-lactamase superfamily)
MTTTLTRVAHASVLLDFDGVRVLTDPVLRPRLGPLRRQPSAGSVPSFGEVDAVLISHTHWDHLDLPSLRALDPEVRLIVPRGAARAARTSPTAIATTNVPSSSPPIRPSSPSVSK